MEVGDLNVLLELITTGVLSTKEGVKVLASYVCNNYKIFGLQKYDEDFRSDIFLAILEKGEKIFDLYKPECGDFFTFVFCFIKSLTKARLKKFAKNIIDEKIAMDESIFEYDNLVAKYNSISAKDYTYSTVPFKTKQITYEQLKEGLSKNKIQKCNKGLFILILRNAYFLKDDFISKTAKIYGIDEEIFFQAIQYLRDAIFNKKERLEQDKEKRNISYYRHKKYSEQQNHLNEDDKINNDIKKSILQKKDENQIHNVNSMNNKLNGAHIYLRPQTRIIADILGLCERQVNYYLHCIKTLKIDDDFIALFLEED